MAPGEAKAKDLTIQAGKVLAVGSNEEVMGSTKLATPILDLQGRTVLPGLIVPSNHKVLSSLFTCLFTNTGFPRYRTKAHARAAMELAAAMCAALVLATSVV